MLPKKTTHFLLAGMLVLSGVCATASENGPLKTPAEKKRADALAQAILTARDEVNAITKSKKAKENFFTDKFETCLNYAFNKHEIAKEREKCEIACTEALGHCHMLLGVHGWFAPENRELMRDKLNLIANTGTRLLPQRIYHEPDGLVFVMAPNN